MFNDIRYGGYLMWELYPHKRVFADGRLVSGRRSFSPTTSRYAISRSCSSLLRKNST